MDPYKFLHIVLNPDGTITRLEKHLETPAQPDPNPHLPVLSKDLSINPLRNTWARIFLPHQALDHSSSSSITKLPMIVFYHAGGFIDYAANTTYFHDFCVQIAQRTQSVLVSVNYRLAPSTVPAAYDDALEALHWIRTSEEKWLTCFADYSKCYLMGESAGVILHTTRSTCSRGGGSTGTFEDQRADIGSAILRRSEKNFFRREASQ
ncbi:hypothetical protein K1719_041686 [Acacia pycnantha]|nr:hypothetical protein K1719_041686 [Acacia pycnantha]